VKSRWGCGLAPYNPNTLSLTPGTRLGVYQITAQIGEGGMGQVYRATDTKLKRQVAIKTLPPSVAADHDRLARFQREAEVLASLNHPHIAAIHGLEDGDGVKALVMELVEGDDLSQRLARGPIPLDEALPIAKQLAEALAAAHEQGIIHRDLKPANIKVRADGTVKVLDFGLAKAMEPADSAPHVSRTPTITAPAKTQAGVILGTAAYMSPEQARGRPIDKRADIWAFGCVLFELLTGKPAFVKDNVSDTLAAVLGTEPDWSLLGPAVPSSLRLLVQRCLEKDRQRRIGDISTAIFLLNEPQMTVPALNPGTATAPARRGRAGRRLAVVAAILLAAVGGGAAVWLQTRPATRRVVRLAIPASGPSALSVSGREMAISPDGTHVAYVGNNGRQLFVRAFDQTDSVPLAGVDFPGSVFIKPDGQWVGFVGEFVLRKVATNGGAVQDLLKLGARSMLGATWGERGTIIFATERTSTGLEQISEDGGATTVLTRPNRDRGEDYHAWPAFLPGGQAVLFTILHTGSIDSAEIAVLDLSTGTHKVILRGGSAARYLPSGHLVYGAAGSLRAVAFDLERLEVRGTPVPVVPQLLTTPNGAADFDVASDGTLVYVRGGIEEPARTLVWVDRQGREEPIPAPVRAYLYLRISPDGTRVAIDVRDQERDIWLWEFARRTLTRFTFAPRPDRFPVWSFDGRRVLYTSERPDTPAGAVTRNLFSQASDGTGVPEQLTRNTTTADKAPTGVSPDGAWVILRDGEPQGFDVSRLALGSDHRIEPLVHTPFSEQNGEVSPDGRWLAYQSNDSGRSEIWVRPYPDVNGGRWLVSAGGGLQPLWSRDGKDAELFYRDLSGDLMRVAVERGSGWAVGATTKLFGAGQYYFGAGEAFGRTYDISLDGRRFLMIKDVARDQSSAPTILVVQNWFDELKALVPTK